MTGMTSQHSVPYSIREFCVLISIFDFDFDLIFYVYKTKKKNSPPTIHTDESTVSALRVLWYPTVTADDHIHHEHCDPEKEYAVLLRKPLFFLFRLYLRR
jgi:hypothetical protein